MVDQSSTVDMVSRPLWTWLTSRPQWTWSDVVDQSSTVDMVLPSVLAVVDVMTPQDYNSLVRRDMKKLINSTRSAQVMITRSTSDARAHVID